MIKSLIHINLYIFLIYIANANLILSTRADEEKNSSEVSNEKNLTSTQSSNQIRCKDENSEDVSSCPVGGDCSELGGDCLDCEFNCTCVYGEPVNVTCSPKKGVDCIGLNVFVRNMTCQYCYQTPIWDHDCAGSADCPAVSSPRKMFRTNCSVKSDVLCLGNRNFPKRIPCNWTSGYQWSTALLLSITLGGFGADRFYLGHWQEGIGKLFSFGGLGVWTIIDVILIAIRYLGPANESLYI